jgi:HD-GYP domain-containing protein (c-di-GMP phosphodiesterase class II)
MRKAKTKPGKGTTTTVSIDRVMVPVSELVIGMYVCELDRPWLGSPFLFQGFPLQSPEDIEKVQQCCRYVFVDVKKSTHQTQPPLDRPPEPGAVGGTRRMIKRRSGGNDGVRRLLGRLGGWAGRATVPAKTVQSIKVAQDVFQESNRFVHHMMEEVRAGKSIDLHAARETIDGCVSHITRHPDAMMLLNSIRTKDEYTAEHSLSVGMLAILLGHQLRLPQRELTKLGICGMLHDVGKIRSPDEILKKPGRLTPEEFQVMKLHTRDGKEILSSFSGIFKEALDVAQGHHERLDGSGYPNGLTASEMGLPMRMVALIDTYDAVTSDRAYARGRTHVEALKILKSESGNHFDGELVARFIAAVGIVPIGSTVRLSDGSYGVIMKLNPKSHFKPTVVVLQDQDAQPIDPRIVDLAKPRRNTRTDLRVTQVLRADECSIDKSLFRDQDFLRSIRR